MSEMMTDMANQLKDKLSAFPDPSKTPEQLALEDVQEQMGQYFTPHVRQGIGIYITQLALHRAEQGEE